MCFKKSNLCDQHPVCDPEKETDGIAWDEFAQDGISCLQKYKEKGLIPKDATIPCQSIQHNEASVEANFSSGIVMIEAVPCDGKPTCWKKPNQKLPPDESFCDNDLLNIWVPGKIHQMFISFSETPGYYP